MGWHRFLLAVKVIARIMKTNFPSKQLCQQRGTHGITFQPSKFSKRQNSYVSQKPTRSRQSLRALKKAQQKKKWAEYKATCRPELKIGHLNFYDSPEWLRLRYEAFERYGNKCNCCGATYQSCGKPLHVDHIKPRSLFPELELTIENIQILCHDCNIGKSNRFSTDWRCRI
jgi:5-methylcytosine-specific restriction endonuclease McrA